MVATRFAVAVHILVLLSVMSPSEATSARLAESINTNPVVVRRIAGQLARAGLIVTRRGARGAALARTPATITLADVWLAVCGAGKLFGLHEATNPDCRIGCRINGVLGDAFGEAEAALVARLRRMTLDGISHRVCTVAA